MENFHNNLIEILTTNAWRENLNTWVFNERSLAIKNFAGQTAAEIMNFSLEKGIGGKFIMVTNSNKLGRLTLTVNYENPLPRIVLESADNKNLYIELQAFNKFSEEQKQLIENKIKQLRHRFEAKRIELQGEILQLQKAKKPDKQMLINGYESRMHQMNDKIEMMQTTVRMTMNIASNFSGYLLNLEHDVEALLNEIEEI